MKRSRIFFIALLVLGTLSMTSCLNDLEDFMGAFSSAPAIAELSESPNAATGTVTREILNPLLTKQFKLRVGIAVAKPLGSPTTVTLAIDNSLVAAYNTKYGLTGSAAALPIPAAGITVSSYDVTIPAGQLEADWTFTIDPTKVPNIVDLFYLLPVKIVSANNGVTVSGNFGVKYIRVLSRNQWDGVYQVTGTMVDAANANLTGYYPHDVDMITTGGTTCAVYDHTIGGYYYPILSSGSLSYYGSFGINMGFDPVANKPISVSNYWGVVSNTRAGAINESYANAVNPTTRDITIQYYMLQPSVITAPPHIRCTMTETWKYLGPRPE
jgi:hypothetical protein